MRADLLKISGTGGGGVTNCVWLLILLLSMSSGRQKSVFESGVSSECSLSFSSILLPLIISVFLGGEADTAPFLFFAVGSTCYVNKNKHLFRIFYWWSLKIAHVQTVPDHNYGWSDFISIKIGGAFSPRLGLCFVVRLSEVGQSHQI